MLLKKPVVKNFAILAGKNLCFYLMKLQTFRPATLLKRDPNTVFSCKYWTIFKNIDFEKHLSMAASNNYNLALFRENLLSRVEKLN